MIVDDKKGSPIPSQKKQKTKKRGGPKRTFEDDYITEEHEEIYIYIYIYCADTHFATLFFFFFF